MISAELPDPDQHPLLHMTVTTKHIHGPCDERHPGGCGSCDEHGNCSKGFKKEYTNSTSVIDGFVKYRRRDPNGIGDAEGNEAVIQRGHHTHTVTNADVVAFNPFCAVRYDSHCNVESCASSHAIRYLFKYCFKGANVVLAQIRKDWSTTLKRKGWSDVKVQNFLQKCKVNEVKRYLASRYVTAPEAFWRMFGGEITSIYPEVVRLDCHLENQQMVYVDVVQPDRPLTRKQREEHEAKALKATATSLTQAMSIAKTGSNARQKLDPALAAKAKQIARRITYPQFPGYFTWSTADKQWKLRKTRMNKHFDENDNEQLSNAVGRVHPVQHSNTEASCFRMILHHIKTPQSFKAARTSTVGDQAIVHSSFMAAALDMGLLSDDQEVMRGLDEAVLMNHPHAFRAAFAVALTFCTPTNPQALYDRYRDDLAADLIMHLTDGRSRPPTDSERHVARHAALKVVVDDLIKRNHHVVDGAICGITVHDPSAAAQYRTFVPDSLRQHSDDGANLSRSERMVLQNTVADRRALIDKVPEQKLLYDELRQAAFGEPDEPISRAVFIDAPAGSGKTMVVETLAMDVRSNGLLAISSALTGIAATLMSEASTYHSMSKAPINVTKDSYLSVTRKCARGKKLIRAAVIFIDEITMMHRYQLECLDRSLQYLMGNEVPFGGKLVVFSGDYRQCLPTVPRGSDESTIAACANSSQLWAHVAVRELSTNMRLKATTGLAEDDILRRAQYAAQLLDIGDGRTPTDDDGNVGLPDAVRHVDSLTSLINATYSGVDRQQPNSYWRSRCILTTKNKTVDMINDQVLAMAPGQLHELFSEDRVQYDGDADAYSEEFLNSLTPSGVPLHRLRVRIGTPVMLLRNLSPTTGDVNGTRYVVAAVNGNSLKLTNLSNGHTFICFRIAITPTDLRTAPIQFTRKQYPLRVCYAATIQKSQGQSLGHTALFLNEPVFSHGALYVALSRAYDPHNVTALVLDHNSEPCRTTKNVVFKSVLTGDQPMDLPPPPSFIDPDSQEAADMADYAKQLSNDGAAATALAELNADETMRLHEYLEQQLANEASPPNFAAPQSDPVPMQVVADVCSMACDDPVSMTEAAAHAVADVCDNTGDDPVSMSEAAACP